MKNWIDDLTLEGGRVKLVPLERAHKTALVKAATDGKLWELWYTSVPSADTVDQYVDRAISQRESGKEYPFVVIDKDSGAIVGSTRYYSIQPEHRRLEIGYTWYAQSHQRTGINAECKFLMLRYAFEVLDCIAVQFMTNWHNLRSRKAIERLGAKQDGVLRNHRLNADGSVRDTVVYSITSLEWAGVKKSLFYDLKQ